MDEQRVLEKLRSTCLSLPGATETITWGHPTFQVAEKTFAVFEKYKGSWSIAFKVELAHQSLFLADPRFFLTPYIGKKGWVSMRVEPRLNWSEIRHLVESSYQLAAAKPARKTTRSKGR